MHQIKNISIFSLLIVEECFILYAITVSQIREGMTVTWALLPEITIQ